ncbi:uncharacterized protein [Prorops nasuta]|uniref:uncharacterized protein n=1 Tax=Prorops nasuta TaxID=863751 RepID=UPI0034CD2B30
MNSRSKLTTSFLLILVLNPIKCYINISDECQIFNGTHIKCSCSRNEIFQLPTNFNYENVTSLTVSSCSTADLHFSTLTEANQIEEITVQNISKELIFELILTSKHVKNIKFAGVRHIPLITHDKFINVAKIQSFEIVDTFIDRFEEQFTDTAVTELIMKNVTINNYSGMQLAEKGQLLRVVDTQFNRVEMPINFAYFAKVEIINSVFTVPEPGQMSIEANDAYIENNIFSNVSMNLVASDNITISNICADGKSSLRLSSSKITSFNNKLPTEIVYTFSKRSSSLNEIYLNINNTVCIAGNCKCQKSSGQDPYMLQFHYVIQSILSALLVFLFL